MSRPPTPRENHRRSAELAERIRASVERQARRFSEGAEASVGSASDELISVTVFLQPRGRAAPDGPVAPNEFWHGGRFVEIGPKPWKLLYVLWTDGPLDVLTLHQRVWGSGPVNRANLRQAVHRANHALNELCGLKLMVHPEDNRLSLEGLRKEKS